MLPSLARRCFSVAAPRRVSVPGGSIACDVRGGGPLPVVLAHGGGQTRHSWRETSEALASTGRFTPITYDHRGHGDSSWAEGGYSLDVYAGDMHSVASTAASGALCNDDGDQNKVRGARAPVVVGASLGGLAAIIAQGELAMPTAGLVIVDIAPRMEPEGAARITGFMQATLGGFETVEEARDAVLSYIPGRSRRPPSIEGLKTNLKFDEEKGRYLWHWDPRFLEWATFNSCDRGREETYERLVRATRNIRVPCLMVRAGMSDLVTPEGARELVDMIPNGLGRFVDVADAHHMVAGDRNTEFVTEILAFLDEIEHANTTTTTTT